MNRVKALLIVSFLLLLSCEKEPVIVKEVFCYDCYRQTIEIAERVTNYMIVSSDTVINTKEFIMKVCMTPSDMAQIELYEGQNSVIFANQMIPPNTFARIKRVEIIKCE